MIKIFAIMIDYAQTTRLLYAGMASLPLFIYWIFLCWVVVLLGVVVSWRAQHSVWTEFLYEQDPYRVKEIENERLKSLLPLLILVVIHGSKKIVTVQELQKILKVSTDWLRLAVISLSSKGYLKNNEGEFEVADAFFLNSEIIPAQKAQEILLNDIKESCLRGVRIGC